MNLFVTQVQQPAKTHQPSHDTPTLLLALLLLMHQSASNEFTN
jgi:hypothetical protein